VTTFQIGFGTSAADLIPGEPAALQSDAAHTRAVAQSLDDAATELGTVDIGPWEGQAADGFSGALATLRARLIVASDTFTAAAGALDRHASVLVEARERAQVCIDSYLAELRCLPDDSSTSGPTPAQSQAMLGLASTLRAIADSEQITASTLRACAEVGPSGTTLMDWLRQSDNPWHADAYTTTESLQMASVFAFGGGRSGASRGGLSALSAERVAMYERLASRSSTPEWLRPLHRGQQFNWQNYDRYVAREVWIDDAKSGARFRLDSYSPDEVVVSRRWTQLGEITEISGKRYIDEMVQKYNPWDRSLRIADTPGNQAQLGSRPGAIGGSLSGDMVFEVPVQTSGVPQSVLRRADEFDILIRDPQGTIYRLDP
jgi:hypothetical protein